MKDERLPYVLRHIATGAQRLTENLTPSEADRRNELLRTLHARVWGEAELEWMQAEIKGPSGYSSPPSCTIDLKQTIYPPTPNPSNPFYPYGMP